MATAIVSPKAEPARPAETLLKSPRTHESLALSKQAVAAWRRRGSIHLAKRRLLTALYGPESAFDEYIGYTATFRERAAIMSAFLRLYDKYRDIHDPRDDEEAYEIWAEALLAFENQMQELVRSGGWMGIDNDGNVSEYTTNDIARVLTALVEAKEEKLGLLGDVLSLDKYQPLTGSLIGWPIGLPIDRLLSSHRSVIAQKAL